MTTSPILFPVYLHTHPPTTCFTMFPIEQIRQLYVRVCIGAAVGTPDCIWEDEIGSIHTGED